MDLTYVSIAVIASMIFVLSGMVGYLYWQQTRILQQIQTLALVVANRIQEQTPTSLPVEEEEEETESVSEDVDDRVEVVEGPQEVEVPTVSTLDAPPAPTTAPEDVDVDDLQSKTAAELRDLLTKKGIPFGKRDSKSVLIQLLKATA